MSPTHGSGASDPGDETLVSSPGLPSVDGEASAPPRVGAVAPRIGHFVILRKVGQGGMGVVYAGYDERLDRKVAIKLLRGHQSGAARQRLAREAQALAKLSHPNVVQIYEIGDHEGAAFIAMEFVEGQTLGAWARAAPRGWSELLAVMLDAGRGLAAAHRKGLVHRDFKPDNVMLDDEGRVRVMDFGLVHGALEHEHDDGEDTEHDDEPDAALEPVLPELAELEHSTHSRATSSLSARLTATGSTLGTPAYMPPEQHAGRTTDARSDQFSFCVALWELLYGERPFAGRTLAQLCIAVSQHELREPPRDADVPGWLRKIIERGLAVDPRDRWADMDELLAALTDDPRRRRGFLLGLGGVLLLALAGFGLHGLSLEREAERLEQACLAEGAMIEQDWSPELTAEVSAGFEASGQPFAPDSWVRTNAQLDRYMEQWSSLRTDACREAKIDHTRTPASLDRVRACLDDARQAFAATIEVLRSVDAGLVAHAARLPHNLPRLSACIDEAALARRPPPGDADGHAKLRADLQRAAALELVADYDASLELAEAVVEQARAREQPVFEAQARLLVGDLRRVLGDYEAAREQYELGFFGAGAVAADELVLRATAKLCAVVGHDLEQHQLALLWGRVGEMLVARLGETQRVDAATLYVSLARLHFDRSDYEAGLASATRARELLEAELGPRHPDVAIALIELAGIHAQLERPDRALELIELAVEIREAAYGPNHPEVATVLGNLGSLLADRGEFEQARAQQQRALAIRQAAFGPDHPAVASSLVALGQLETAQGHSTEGIELYERALAIREAALGPSHGLVAAVLDSLAIAHYKLGNFEQMLAFHTRSQAIREQLYGPDHPNLAVSLSHGAMFLLEMQRYDEAEAALERARIIYEANYGLEHRAVARTILGLGSVLDARGDPQAALVAFERGHELLERVLGPDHFALADSLFMIGDAHLQLDELDRAQAAFERALQLELAAEAGGARTAETRVYLAQVLAKRGELDAAREQALAAREDLRGVDMPEMKAELEAWLAEHPG